MNSMHQPILDENFVHDTLNHETMWEQNLPAIPFFSSYENFFYRVFVVVNGGLYISY